MVIKAQTAGEQQAEKQTAKISGAFSADELAANAKRLFDCSPDIVRAALKMKRISECTVDEAKTIVDAFAKKGVKK